MTLIFAHINPVTGLLVASDMLISRPDVGLRAPVKLPLRDQEIQHGNSGYALAGFSQKTVIFGRTLVTFAGSVIVAKRLINLIYQASISGENEIDIEDIFQSSGLNEGEINSVSIIYLYNGDTPAISQQVWQCEKAEISDGEFVLGNGTGWWDFFQNIQTQVGRGRPSHEVARSQILGKFAHAIMGERWETTSLDFMYGGWFEFAYRSGKTFTKVPYAMKLWARKGPVLATGGPTIASWYQDYGLHITRMQKIEVNGTIKMTRSTQYIPDILGRSRDGTPRDVYNPIFIVHSVADEDSKSIHLLIDHEPYPDGMDIEISPRGSGTRYTEAFRQKMLNLGKDKSQPEIFRLTDK